MATQPQQRGNGITSCLLCGDDGAAPRRGLCPKHYARFYKALQRCPVDLRDVWEQSLIDEGKLLPSRQGKRIGPEDDEFAVSVDEFVATRQAVHAESAAARAETSQDLGSAFVGPPQPPGGSTDDQLMGHVRGTRTDSAPPPTETSPAEEMAKFTGHKPKTYTKGRKNASE